MYAEWKQFLSIASFADVLSASGTTVDEGSVRSFPGSICTPLFTTACLMHLMVNLMV